MFIRMTTLATAAALIVSASLARAENAAPCSNGPVILGYGDHASCSLASGSDIDVYRFFGERGDKVIVTVAGKSNNLDAKFEVYDPVAQLVFGDACSADAYHVCSASKGGILPWTGEFTILVSDSGQNNSGSYDLDLQRVSPLVPEQLLYFNTSHPLALGHYGDHDFLTFEGAAGDLIRVSLAGTSNNLDCAYVLYDPDSIVVDSGNCSADAYHTCSVASPNLILPLDGSYNLMVYDSGNNNKGNLNVTVTCVVGACPPNWGPIGTNYCATNPNSTGNAATIKAWGSELVVDETLLLYGSDVPQSQFGIFFMGLNQTNVPFGDGNRCVGGGLVRFEVINSYNRAQFRLAPDFADLPGGMHFLPGQTWNFQCWFRDPDMGLSGFNTSDALSITFQ